MSDITEVPGLKGVYIGKPKNGAFEFHSPICSAIAHDLCVLQTPGHDYTELNYSPDDLESILLIARGIFIEAD